MNITDVDIANSYAESKKWEGTVDSGGKALVCTDIIKFLGYVKKKLMVLEEGSVRNAEAMRICQIIVDNFHRTSLGIAKLHAIECLMANKPNEYIRGRWGR